MPRNETPGRRRPYRVLVGLLVVGVIAAALMLVGPRLVGPLASQGGSLLGGPECTVETAEGNVGLDREMAKRATTAAALLARGAEAPDTTGIDDAVIERLVDGPADDAGPSLHCRGSAASDLEVEDITASGLTPRAEQVRIAMAEVFGDQSLGGFAPGGVGQGHGGESTHYDGRAIDVFFRPVTEDNRRQGWILSHWLVAHAADLDIQYVIFDDEFWSARLARGGWHYYDAPAPGNEILRHLDHVHVDVIGGGNG
ncbi:hypothetical protein IWX64_000944 [Arthrobacter sp. CAN_A212]|uniref:hypothetical protein n=1 Tax=unclassified Arthrobacter TaxID=235627 RepID=UPI0018CAEE76|nr:hypothetical protein [Arthrobacter sp. CAN_C5]MBP2218108.1 hypothetical protein [Arthrobacter sp. CAN_C5]